MAEYSALLFALQGNTGARRVINIFKTRVK